MKQRAIIAERAWDSAKWKVGVLEGKLEDSNSKLAEAISLVLARDKELTDLKGTIKQIEQ